MYGSVEGVKNNLPKLAKYIKPDGAATGATDIKQTAIEAVLEEYSSRVDAALTGLYAVPFAAAPAVINSIVTDLASAKISLQYQTQIGAEENQNILAMRKDAKELLASLAKGDAKLPGLEPIANPDTLTDLFSSSADESVFDMGDPSTWQAKV